MATIDVTSDGSVAVGDSDIVELNIAGGGDVTITAADSSVDFFKIKFLDDTEADSVTVDLSTFAQDGLRIDILQYDPSDSIGFIGGFGFMVNPDRNDEFLFSYIGSDGNTYTGFIRALDGGEKDFTDPFQPIQIICFGDGTLIDTPHGPVKVEDLRPGDMVLTRDNGPQPLRWVGRRALSAEDLRKSPDFRPLLVGAHTFGQNTPHTDMVLSPNHRVMLTDWKAEMLFGEAEVLVAARFLSKHGALATAPIRGGVGYNHLLFDQHEIVVANGLACESLYPGPEALNALDDGALSEIRALFPEALEEDIKIGPPARRILRSFEATALLGPGEPQSHPSFSVPVKAA